MVEAPAVRCVLLRCDAEFALDEQPALPHLRVLISGEEARVVRQELLQDVLSLVRLFDHLD